MPNIPYSSLDPCPRCGDGSATPVPGRNAPACTITGCGERTAAPDIDPTAHRTSLEAHHEGVEHWLTELVDDMSDRGYLVDIGALCDAQDAAEPGLEAATAEMVALGIGNPNDPKQILQALEDAGCEFDPRFVNEKGNPSTKNVALGVYAEHQPHLQALTTAIVTYKVAKQRSDQLRSIDEAIDLGRVHPTIKPRSSESGRMAMKAPALMNLRRELRGVLMAQPGHVLVRSDFDTVEWRVAAALSGDRCLVERIEAGVDVHSALASDVFGPDHTPEQRALAKKLSFQVLFGAGVDGVVRETGLSRREAERIRTDIWAAYPKIDEQAAFLRRRGTMPTPYGRLIHAPADAEYKLYNYLVQGTARDLLVHVLCRLADLGWADNVWMLLHDEIILQVPEGDARAAVDTLNKAMNLDLLGVPVTASAEILGERWR